MKREVHPLPKVDESLAQLSGAVVFTPTVGVGKSHCQKTASISLLSLRHLVIIISINCHSGSVVHQSTFKGKWSQILDGLEGTLCHMDDVLVYGRNREEHDDRLTRVCRESRMLA